jgi:hypothetical protein
MIATFQFDLRINSRAVFPARRVFTKGKTAPNPIGSDGISFWNRQESVSCSG